MHVRMQTITVTDKIYISNAILTPRRFLMISKQWRNLSRDDICIYIKAGIKFQLYGVCRFPDIIYQLFLWYSCQFQTHIKFCKIL